MYVRVYVSASAKLTLTVGRQIVKCACVLMCVRAIAGRRMSCVCVCVLVCASVRVKRWRSREVTRLSCRVYVCVDAC